MLETWLLVSSWVVVARAEAEVVLRVGIFNPNRRHDDPEEKRMDMIRAEINASHRFHSFAGERSHNFVKWSVYCIIPAACMKG